MVHTAKTKQQKQSQDVRFEWGFFSCACSEYLLVSVFFSSFRSFFLLLLLLLLLLLVSLLLLLLMVLLIIIVLGGAHTGSFNSTSLIAGPAKPTVYRNQTKKRTSSFSSAFCSHHILVYYLRSRIEFFLTRFREKGRLDQRDQLNCIWLDDVGIVAVVVLGWLLYFFLFFLLPV